MFKSLIDFFKGRPPNSFFELDPNREYSNKELLHILTNETITVGLGQVIVTTLLNRINDKTEKYLP